MARNGAKMNEAEENVNERLCSKHKLARPAVLQQYFLPCALHERPLQQ